MESDELIREEKADTEHGISGKVWSVMPVESDWVVGNHRGVRGGSDYALEPTGRPAVLGWTGQQHRCGPRNSDCGVVSRPARVCQVQGVGWHAHMASHWDGSII